MKLFYSVLYLEKHGGCSLMVERVVVVRKTRVRFSPSALQIRDIDSTLIKDKILTKRVRFSPSALEIINRKVNQMKSESPSALEIRDIPEKQIFKKLK